MENSIDQRRDQDGIGINSTDSRNESKDSDDDDSVDELMSKHEESHHADVVKKQHIEKLNRRFSQAPSLLKA